ncbi:MAG: hypothetical protein IT331_17805 [Anaerolineae bacterium]|nr:hypothetical protein [Anaerolineae bacterium]
MKNGKAIFLGLGVLVLAMVAVGVLFLLNSRPAQTTQPPNTPRSGGAASAGNTEKATPDPLDDSGAEPLPNVPVDQGDKVATVDQLDDSAPNTNNPNIPPAREGMVTLPGTAWTQMTSDEKYKFCSDNTWQISNPNDTVTGTGTFEQTDAVLVMSGAGDPRTYQLTWDSAASVLELKQGDAIMNLAYKGASNCP